MKRGTYVGPREHLKGKTAQLRVASHSCVLAQFDDRSLTVSGNPMPKVLGYEPHARFPTEQDPPEPPEDALGFGWHVFLAHNFTEAL